MIEDQVKDKFFFHFGFLNSILNAQFQLKITKIEEKILKLEEKCESSDDNEKLKVREIILFQF